jgi:hypothetical protein
LNNVVSVEAFLQAKELRKTNVQKDRERRGLVSTAPTKRRNAHMADSRRH